MEINGNATWKPKDGREISSFLIGLEAYLRNHGLKDIEVKVNVTDDEKYVIATGEPEERIRKLVSEA